MNTIVVIAVVSPTMSTVDCTVVCRSGEAHTSAMVLWHAPVAQEQLEARALQGPIRSDATKRRPSSALGGVERVSPTGP